MTPNLRSRFREAVMARDGYRCRKCGGTPPLEPHQITQREVMPRGGYVAENGVTLCVPCYAKAMSSIVPGYTPEELYRLIGSSREKAVAADLRCT